MTNRDYEMETKPQSYQRKASKKAKTEKITSTSVKCEGFAHSFLLLQWHGDHEFLPQGRTVNKEYYLEVRR